MCNVFETISELRALGFGVIIGTLGPDSFTASYVFWPMVEANNNNTLAFDKETARLLASSSAIGSSPEEAINELKTHALAQLPNLRNLIGVTPQPTFGR